LCTTVRYSHYRVHHEPAPETRQQSAERKARHAQNRYENPVRFVMHWRTVSPEYYEEPASSEKSEYFPYSWSSSLAEIEPGKLARKLGILPHEYPVLTGIFEFDFDHDYQMIVTHTITDLEYLTKPAADEARSAIGAA
jgi:hypothetical protein